MLGKNLFANYLGQSWRMVMAIAFIPFYVEIVGAESYGLIGIFATLQAWLAVLDMGLRPAISREMARFTGNQTSPNFVWDLLRTVEFITIGMVLLIFGVSYAASDWLSINWLNNQVLDHERVSFSIVLIGLTVGLVFLESLYSSCLIGLQQQVKQNIILVLTSTLRGVGAIVVLQFISPTIEAFFVWQALCIFLSIILFRNATVNFLPTLSIKPKFSLDTLREVWKFASGMVGITLVSLVLTQMDKIVLTRYISLEEFGYYTIAFTVSSALYALVTPVSQAFLPRLTQLAAQKDNELLAATYHIGCQIVTVLAGSAGIVLIFFSEQVINIWASDLVLTSKTSKLVSLLCLGTLLNCLMWMPFQLQIAYGWTKLSLSINSFTVFIVVPILFFIAPVYGAMGVAWMWVLLNFFLLVVGITLMHRRLLPNQKFIWIFYDILIPIVSTIILLAIWKTVMPQGNTVYSDLINLFIGILLAISSLMIFSTKIHPFLGRSAVKKIFNP